MTTETPTTIETVQMYRVYIRATAEAIWEAITKPEWTVQYGYAPLLEYDLRPGGAFPSSCERGHEGAVLPRRDQRRRGDRSRPTAQAGPDLAYDHDARAGRRGIHPGHL